MTAQPKVKKLNSETNLTRYQTIEKWITDNYHVRQNLVSTQVEVRNKGHDTWQTVSEPELVRQLEHNHIKSSPQDVKILLESDYPKPYDPFKAYFEELPPYDFSQGSEIDRLASFVKVDENHQERFLVQFKKWLVRAVKTATIPNYYNKQIFIFQSEEQNNGKSSFCIFLLPPKLDDYYTETFDTDKDGLFALAENFLINLDELASLHNSEINKLKKYVSTVKIKARRPYGRFAKATVRRASFVGSTNQTEFLKDETGSVRFIVIPINSIDFDYSNKIDIDKVWSEAYQLSKHPDFKAEMSSEELRENELANKEFTKQTKEEELIIEKLEPSNSKDDFKTASQVITMLEWAATDFKSTPEKIGLALTKLNYKRISKRTKESPYPKKGYLVKLKTENFDL